jgi:sugar phosphate isomerase/epimerase
LRLNDLHASHGQEKDWGSAAEHQRLAGVELIKNRIDMTARLGADVVILHLPAGLGDDQASWSRLRRSLDALEPYARACHVRIAIENGDFEAIRRVLAAYDPEFLGLCYDSGHGNMVADGLDRLESLKHRLISVHLHDNNGASDQHKLPFTGTVDWSRLARIIAESSYTKCVSLETTMRETGIDDEDTFLARAFEAGTRLARMIDEYRQATSR